jgi:hypothetical protein
MMSTFRPVLAVLAAFLIIATAAAGADLLSGDRRIEEVVDHFISQALKKAAVTPAPAADDATLVRRLTLDLAGRIPTAAEARAYIDSTDRDKRVHLVDRLMAAQSFARHQVNELDTMLTSGGRDSLREYLIVAVGQNRPWDRIFREIMLPDQTDKAQKAAAVYLIRGIKDLDRLTAEVSSTFFGVNISCAQCHDHPLVPDWKQDHFYGMKAFFARTFATGTGNNGFLGERGSGEVRFKTTDDIERKARLMFLTGRRVDEPNSQDLSSEDKKKERDSLDRAKKAKAPPPAPAFSARAKLVEVALSPTEREFFSRAIVNRLWHRLMGHGLVMPLDQMHSANPPSHPELLAWLARDLATHGYDLRRLIRGLVLSDTYARATRWEGKGDAPAPSLFAAALVRPLTPMQLATSLLIATADPVSMPPDIQSAQFARRIETCEESARTLSRSFATSGGDPQIGASEALFFSNGKQVAEKLLRNGPDTLVGLLDRSSGPAEAVRIAMFSVLSRFPDAEEKKMLSAFLDERTDRPEDAHRQLVWALLAGSEFRFNH